MQGSAIWSAPQGTLGRIVHETADRVCRLREVEPQIAQAAAGQEPATGAFARALRQQNVSVIAEVKRKSPSKGWISEALSAPDQAWLYEAGGAAAVSVLTEPNHFDGSIDDLRAVLAAVRIPVIKKDFHVDPVQLLEARALGATAALLIARALSPADLPRMTEYARRIGLETVVEIRDEPELVRAIDSGATIIGINNRDLETLVIDPTTSDRLLPLIPADIVAIAESGMSTADDVRRAASFGADAVLVGSSLSSAPDPRARTMELSSIPRVGRNA